MAKNIQKIAKLLGAKVVEQVPETGGGAFGAAWLGEIIADLQARLQPGQGKRSGRPTVVSWVHHPKVPMSDETVRRLALLAEEASAAGKRVSPMQLAAQLLEEALARCSMGKQGSPHP